MQTIEQLTALAADNLDAVPWYSTAQAELATICKLEQWQAERFTGILAVTSPRCAVRRNIRIALQYVGKGELLANVMRSIRTSVKTFETSGEILGPKTSAFYAALLGDESAIVLDVHMADLFGVRQSIAFRRKAELRHWTTIVRRVGDRLGIAGRDAQACLWYGAKRRKGENPEAFPIVAEYRNWLSYDRSFPHTGYIPSDESENNSADDFDNGGF